MFVVTITYTQPIEAIEARTVEHREWLDQHVASGLIGFVGIMVPHLVRLVAGSSYRLVLPLSIVVGAAFLILADIPGRVLEHGGETPIGVVTALVGAPMFIFVLRSRRAVA